MMMSMFSSVSALRSHQSRMDVIGNNIANVNTVGFKSSQTTFQEIFATTFRGAGAPDAATGRGGTNPMQVGLGMGVASIDVQMSRGSIQRTDSPTDLSIEGEGFFVVKAGDSGTYNFSRAGNFTIDRLGNLVTASGQNVYGWMKYDTTDAGVEFDIQEPIKALNLYEDEYNLSKRIIAAQKSSQAVMAGNLDATSVAKGLTANTFTDTVADGIPDNGTVNYDPDFIAPINVYDSLGNPYKINVQFYKNFITPGAPAVPPAPASDPVTSWYWRAVGDSTVAASAATGFIQFDASGKLITSDVIDYNTTPTVTLTPGATVGAGPFDVKIDMAQLSMYSDDSSVKPLRVDGYPPGTLVTFSVGSDGILTGVYDNGRQQPLGRVGMATFSNPAGLSKVGNNLFAATSNSGEFNQAVVPGSMGTGTIVPGTLEMSNVDLAKQFTEMIITQRGFQANSRVMTTSDEILQELTNMKR